MIKMEVFEKVGEIEVVSLRPACENSKIAEAVRKRQEEEERKRKEEEERKKMILAKDVVSKLAKAINAKAERGNTCLYLEWHDGEKYDTDNYTNISWDDFANAFDHTLPMLESAGYKVNDLYLYSDKYRRQSGKIGYIYIRW